MMRGTHHDLVVRERPPRARSPQAPPQIGEQPAGVASYVLHLQRTAGNQAVELLLRRYQDRPPVMRAPLPGASAAVSGGSLLDDRKMKAALAWGANGAHIGTEAITALQTRLGMAAGTGDYDQDTAEQVAQWQHAQKLPVDGIAGPATFTKMGLILTREISAAGLSSDLILEHLQTEGGAAIAVYAEYRGTTSAKLKTDEAEFKLKADTHAQRFGALGLHGTDIAQGRAIPVNGAGEVIEKVQSIELGLTARYRQLHPDAQTLPPFLRVKNLAIFSHGLRHSMGLDPGNTHTAARGGLSETNLKAFADGLAGALASDVRVQLFACSTAEGGSDSLAAHLAQDVGPGASVYGHTTEGNTTENFNAVVFGKDAGGSANPQGLPLFDVLFPEEYQTAELARLFPEDDSREARRKKLVDQMRKCYVDAIGGTLVDSKKWIRKHLTPMAKGTPNMGDEMFTSPENARQLFHDHWQTRWLADPGHLQAITPDQAR